MCLFVQVFKKLADFDVSDVFGNPKDDGHMWWPGLSSKRRRRSSVFPWHWDITKDAYYAFTVRMYTYCPVIKATTLPCLRMRLSACLTQETGLVVMTDVVSLNHRQSEGMYTDEAVPAFQPHTSTLVSAMDPRLSHR